MKTRELGKSGVKVSAIGLGCMGMSEFYGAHDDQESIRVIHHALDIGVTFLDTADMYGVGRNEELVGKAIKDRRKEVFLATKFGNMRGKDGAFLGVSGRPEYVRECCDASLKRLGVDVIDLYYQHRIDANVPVEDTWGAMKELVDRGKVRFLGISEASPDTIRRAEKVHPILALQSEYSLWTRELEPKHIPTCRELGIGIVPYSPLGRAFLSGKYKSPNDIPEDDWRRMNPRFQGENFQKNLELVKKVEEIAKEKGCTPAQLALAWVLAQGDDMVPIPGTKHKKYLDENAAAVDITLAKEELDRIDAAFPLDAAAGDRYPEFAMKFLNG